MNRIANDGVFKLDSPKVAEFFAGIGLVRLALESQGFEFLFANDYSEIKERMYKANFGGEEFVRDDIRFISGAQIPPIDLATASFPCTDLSLAGTRTGLNGSQSGMLWEFLRILKEMKRSRPRLVTLENVTGFITSNNGKDLRETIIALNELGYVCDLLVLDARWFVPQSRPRLFLVGSTHKMKGKDAWSVSKIRPKKIIDFVEENPDLRMQALRLPDPPDSPSSVSNIVERMTYRDRRWWEASRVENFLNSLSDVQAAHLTKLRQSARTKWATAYRRTRNGVPVWEIRTDSISGCLRTTGGGSSKQAIVEANSSSLRIRWMTAKEYAALQGAPDFDLSSVSESQARFAFGDAVCVPAVAWLAEKYLMPMTRALQAKVAVCG